MADSVKKDGHPWDWDDASHVDDARKDSSQFNSSHFVAGPARFGSEAPTWTTGDFCLHKSSSPRTEWSESPWILCLVYSSGLTKIIRTKQGSVRWMYVFWNPRMLGAIY